MRQQLWVLDKKLEYLLPLILILFAVVIIRLPALFEPVWYLDESVYLTIGHALNQGAVLYRDVVDHKTPIIYYLARVGGQTQFTLLLLGWMLATTTALYIVLQKTLTSKKVVFITTLVFALASASPRLEGLLPNGELFVMGFVMWGLLALTKSRIWEAALGHGPNRFRLETSVRSEFVQAWTTDRKSQVLVIASGSFFSLALLTKVPAVFDLMSVALLVFVGFWRMKRQETFREQLGTYGQWIFPELSLFGIGLFMPIVLTLVYFAWHSALADYLQFGLLYNFHYAGSWVPSASPFTTALLSLPAKVLLCLVGLSILTLLRHHLNQLMFWASSWSLFALFGATLSNRPYPHYFIQVILPLTFVLGAVLSTIQLWWQRADIKGKKQVHLSGHLVTSLVLLLLVTATWQVLGTWKYSTAEYYSKFFSLLTHRISAQEYSSTFSSQVLDNYAAQRLLADNQIRSLYIWGTNPSLYVLTKTYPTDRLLVLFHVQDMQNEAKTIQNVMADQPEVIAIMNDADSVPPSFRNFVHNQYTPWHKFESFTLWRLRSRQ